MKNLIIASLTALALVFGFACSDDDDNGGNGSSVKTCQSACTKDADCLTGTKCQTSSGKCVMCTADADCTTGLKKCNTTSGICKFCEADKDCEMSGVKIMTGKCDSTTSMCLKCAADKDCGFTGSTMKTCKSGVCSTGGTTTTKCDATTCPAPMKCDGDKCSCASDADCKSVFKADAYKCK